MSQQQNKCRICSKESPIMKRCTRCQSVYYCSRSCQIQDWPRHKQQCQTNSEQLQPNQQCTSRTGREKDIWEESDLIPTESTKPKTVRIRTSHTVDHTSQTAAANFQTAFDNLGNNVHGHDIPNSKSMGTYLCNNKVMSDLPILDPERQTIGITVKSNKQKLVISLQEDWSSSDMLKTIAHRTEIPLDKLKLIHKGKVITDESLCAVVKNKAVFQAIGEKAEKEEGVEGGDIDILMKQLAVDRNDAVKALKQKGDVVDAILYLSNK